MRRDELLANDQGTTRPSKLRCEMREDNARAQLAHGRIKFRLVSATQGINRQLPFRSLGPHLVKRSRRGGVIPHYIFATARNGLSIYAGQRARALTLVAPLGGNQSSR